MLKGIEGKVTNFTYTELSYPYIVFGSAFKSPKHKMNVVSNMVKSGILSNKDISLYVEYENGLYKIGMLSGLQVGSFLDLVGLDGLYGYLDENTKLSGDRLYVLSTI